MTWDPGDDLGMPIGISIAYDSLPTTGEPGTRNCGLCWRWYTDTHRLIPPSGSVGIAVMCPGCREKSRKEWIKKHPPELPVAIATYRSKAK